MELHKLLFDHSSVLILLLTLTFLIITTHLKVEDKGKSLVSLKQNIR